MSNHYFEHEFANGLHLLVEPMPGVRSAAFTLLVPGGAAHDRPGSLGCANILSSLITRGAGDRDSRSLSLALDNLGIQRHESTEIYHTSVSAAALAENLLASLDIFADVLRRPRLEAEHLEFCKAATLQELQAIEDDPSQKLSIELKRRSLPPPLGRPIPGNVSDVGQLDIQTVVDFHRGMYRPNGAILGVAGAVDFETVVEQVAVVFADWEPVESAAVTLSPTHPSRDHLYTDKAQTHIGISYPAVSYRDPDFYNMHGIVGVLSGGMSARLFTEVREKRGLCYSVGASFCPLRDLGVIYCYAGTTNERAGETLDVLLGELDRLKDGISENEVRRVQAGLKSSLIMQEESTSARASILAHGWYNLGRVRTLHEVAEQIDRLSPASLLDCLERRPPKDFNILTLGPSPLELSA